jgi:ABC-type glycerol-3-phosphate transport system substrate-binding protein
MMKLLRMSIFVALALFVGISVPAPATAKIVIEVTATEPEYAGQDRAIWDLFEQENPNITIKITPINEDTEAAYQTRIAAGDPADIRTNIFFPNKDNYQVYANLLTLPVKNWEYLTYNGKMVFEQTSGIKNYAPSFNVQLGPFRTFIFYADEMRKAGLDPKNSVKTLADLDAFLAKLHTYVKTRSDLQYTFDAGWSANAWGRTHLEAVVVATGGTKEQMRDLFRGKIKWTDMQNNPFVPALKKMKEWYDKGYLPRKWWTRAWETEYETGFIAKKSILAFHGPWLFDKTLAQRPPSVPM